MSGGHNSRFRSAAGKKIEKEVRKDAIRFHQHANTKRGHGVASGANFRGKPTMDSNIGQKRDMSNENLASSTMNTSKTNRRDNVANDANRRDNISSLLVSQTPIKDSNTRHMKSSTMNARKNNRTDDRSLATLSRMNNKRSVVVEANQQVNHASRPMKHDPPRKNTNTKRVEAIMPNGYSTPMERSGVVVEANQQINHALRPMKHDPPRKNTNTKRIEAIMPNGALTPMERSGKSSNKMRQPTTSSLITRRDDSIVEETTNPLKAMATMNISKHINNSQSPQFKAMAGLVHRTNRLDGYNDASPSRLKRQVSLDNGEGFIFDYHSASKLTIKEREEVSHKRMKRQRNKEAKGDDTSDRNPMGEINGVAYPFGVKDYSKRNPTFGSMKRQRGNTKTNEDEAIDNGDKKLIEVEDGDTQLETCDHRPKNKKKKRGIESKGVSDVKDDDSFAKKNLESFPNDHVSLGCSNEAIEAEKLTHRKLKISKQGIMRNEDEELHVDGHSLLDVDDDSSRLTSHDPISADCLAEVPGSFVLENVKQQCNYCSKPIDKPIWSGIFKIDGEKYISLAGHLSTKSCDKVWELSRSLALVVEVTKLSRPKFKIWETSKPSCDSIGLYFFPSKLRHDEYLDKLVKEVIEDDLVLQTVIGEAEMLIFPSTLLPERYKTFQRKHYLWGVFRPRQDHCATVAEPMHDTACRAQENEKEEQHASNQQDEVQEVHWKSPAKSMQQAAATGGVPWSPNMDFQPGVPEERQLGEALRHTLPSAEATAVATNPAAVTTEAAPLVTNHAALTTEVASLATNPVAATTEAAPVATNPAAVTTEAAAVATNSAAVTTEAAAFATNPAAVTIEAAALATNDTTGPAEATENGTNVATIPGNHGRSDSIVGVPPGRYFYFVAGQSPKLEQLIQEMQREGSLVLAIRGEAIGAAGSWPGNIAFTNNITNNNQGMS